MRVLRQGDRGADVKAWQHFLIGQGFVVGEADGVFGKATHEATLAFQAKQKLVPDGLVADRTLGEAATLGFPIVKRTEPSRDKEGPNFPPKPDFKPLVGAAERQKLFGKFEFNHKPLKGNPENIEVLGDWVKENVTVVEIPQLKGVRGAGSGRVQFHVKAAEQLQRLFEAWEKEELMDRVLTWEGTYVARFVRGSTKTLSNHAFATAFDINVKFNGLGVRPTLVGREGSVRELVPIANKLGFYWGGHFTRLDGMHFEVAQLKS